MTKTKSYYFGRDAASGMIYLLSWDEYVEWPSDATRIDTETLEDACARARAFFDSAERSSNLDQMKARAYRLLNG